MSDEYDAAVAASMQPNAAQSARVGFAVASDTNADAYAEAQRVARRTGVPVDTAMALSDEMRRQDRMGSIDFDALAKTSPATAALLGNVERAKVAHDDIDNLSGFESMLYSVGKFEVGTGKAIASAVPKFNEGMWGVARAGAETFVPEVLGRKVLADKFAQWGGMQREMANGLMPKAEGLIESSWYSGMQSLGLNALLLPISLASGGSMAPMLAGMGLSTGGAAYGEARDKGVSVPQALAFGASQGVIEAGTEMIGMPALFSLLKPGSFLKKAGEYMVKDQGGEQVATHLQDLNEWAVLNPDKPLGDYLRERPGAAVQTALATAFGGGGQVALMKGVEIIATRNDIRVDNADKTLDLLGRINEMATASKVLARDADTFEAHVNAIAETGQAPAAVFVSAQTLQQAGIAEQLAQVSPAVAEQMEIALQMGGDIRIPIAEYATKIAPTEYAQAMVDHIKFDAEGFSKAEAQTYMQEKAPELQAEVDRVLGEQSADETWKASAQEVEDAVFGEMQTAGRFTEHVNRTDAVLHKAFASVMAAKLGVTPMEFFKTHTLRVIAEQEGGTRFDQAGQIDAVRQQWAKAGVQGDIFENNGIINLSRIVVPESERGAGKGTAAMQALVDYADRTGQHVALSPASDFGGNKKRLIQFYKRFGFVENKGKNRAFSTSESMYRQADGKVLYQTTRGSFNPATNTIALLKNADLSTFLHESGHFFLEVQASVAGQLAQDAAIHGADTLKPGERQILDDHNALLAWFGVKDMAEWSNLDFEEKRAYHEQFARGFESYLFEGKAPSIELHGVFQRFRAWLLNVYKSLTALNVELTPEVRGVFDRMLATTEQIQLAEQARSMMPLFERADQAGMTPEDFADYQAQGVDATNTASEELQARGLRDMQWLHNARGRMIKKLQKESEARRAEVRMDARREIMSQPVYRAWSFLTRKVERDDMLDGEKARADHQTAMKAWEDKRTAFDTEIRKDAKQTVWAASEEGQKKYQKGGTLAKAQAKVLRREEKAIDAIAEKALAEWEKANRKPTDPDARQKPDLNSVDESQDSLFAAIAKLGGINKAELISTWGVDPADKASSGVFGKHVMRATDQGLSIDGMAEQLSQYGYLQLDENGKWDLAELEEKFKAELGGDAQHSISFDYGAQHQQDSAGRDLPNPDALQAGRLNRDSLDSMGLPPEVVKLLDAQRMVKRDGLHPDIVAEIFGFSSGDEMVRALAAADKPGDAIEGLTDQHMLEQYGDLSSQQEIEKAADQAIHNDVRARMVATEANALAKATGKPKILAEAAKAFASAMIARLKVRNITPGQYASAEARAAKAAAKASKAGDLVTAGAEKRNQLINGYATRAAYDAQTEVEKIVRYFKAIDKSKTLPADYLAQIQMLLDKYDLRAQSGAAIDRKASLRTWVQSRLNLGEIPAISEALLSPAERKQYEAQINARDEEGNLVYPDDDERIKLLADAIEASAKRPYKELTVEELRGLNDTIKQIEHLGKLKDKLLTKMEGAGYAATRDLLAATVEANAKEQGKNTRTDNTWLGGKIDALKQFGASHIKPAIWMRIFDGGQDNGPWWATIVRPANERATFETTRRAAATSALMEILGPVLSKVSHLDQIGKGRFFPLIGASLNWQERMAFAFNYGNESNLQRLMGGGIAGVTKALTMGQVQSVLNTLSAAEWHAVQAVWDHFETYRPEIAAKELRVNGTEPKWIDARQFMIKTSDGETLTLRGGYFPVKFDAKTSLKAQQHSDAQASKDAMKAAYSAATTQRSFTKERVEEVTGRPLLLNLSGLYSGVNDVIHDLAWHEWVIDVNRLLRSESIDAAIREHYGANVKKELTKWRDDIVAGSARLDHGIENAAGWARKFVSSAALTYNVISALMQPLGITQSFSRVGAKWVGMGLGQYASGPIEATRIVQGKSEYMTNRTRTMFRDINELRNRVAGQTTGRELMGRYGYYLTMHFQMMVDVPTWIGAYEKALSGGNADDVAIALADQSVKDSQGGGEEVDQSGITRGGPMVKLFTAFYDFMNTQANVLYLKNATAPTRADAWMNMALVGLATPLLAAALRDALIPGDSGDWEDWDKVWKKLLTEGMGNLIGMMAFGREFSQAAKALLGDDKGMGYTGPAGIRVIPDIGKLGKQINQGELDDAFRKSFITVLGDFGGIPAVQINRTITGANAMQSGETDNPAALVFGFQKKH